MNEWSNSDFINCPNGCGIYHISLDACPVCNLSDKPRMPDRQDKSTSKQSHLEKRFTDMWQKYASDYPMPETEYRFHDTRRFRFDFAWSDLKLAVEIEGGLHIYGRHNNPTGYKNDLEKYNLACECGWAILRYSNVSKEDIEQIKRIIDNLS